MCRSGFFKTCTNLTSYESKSALPIHKHMVQSITRLWPANWSWRFLVMTIANNKVLAVDYMVLYYWWTINSFLSSAIVLVMYLILNWHKCFTVNKSQIQIVPEFCEWFVPGKSIFCQMDLILYFLVLAILLPSFTQQPHRHFPWITSSFGRTLVVQI